MLSKTNESHDLHRKHRVVSTQGGENTVV